MDFTNDKFITMNLPRILENCYMNEINLQNKTGQEN